MLYLQKYLTNFQKLFFSERRGTCLLLLKISTAQIFSFSNSNVTTFPSSRKCKYFNFAFHTVPAEMLYLLNCLTNFVKSFFRLKEEEPGYWVWKFTVRRYFRFAVARLQLFQHAENVNISILHFPLSQQKWKAKLKYLHFLDDGKVVTLLLENENICAVEIFNNNRHVPLLSEKKSFWKFVKYFWRYNISAGTVSKKRF